MMDGKRKYKIEASFTVEAAYVCPLMFFLIFTVLWFAFTLHDRVAVDAWSVSAAEEARMALQYGKIPHSDKIYKNGFNDKEGRELLEDLAADRTELDGICMSNPKPQVSTELEKTSLSIGVILNEKEPFGVLTKGLLGKTLL